MEKTITAFISLGFACGGPEMGDYGTFTVDLTEAEIKLLDEIVKEETKGYKRHVVEERYPDLHKKIVDAAKDLVRDVIVHDGMQFIEDFTEEDETIYDSLDYHSQAEFLVKKFNLEPEILDADVCYYLCRDELPRDFRNRW